MNALSSVLTQMNELAELTAHYYEKGFYRDEKYSLQWLLKGTAKQRRAEEAVAQSDRKRAD